MPLSVYSYPNLILVELTNSQLLAHKLAQLRIEKQKEYHHGQEDNQRRDKHEREQHQAQSEGKVGALVWKLLGENAVLALDLVEDGEHGCSSTT